VMPARLRVFNDPWLPITPAHLAFLRALRSSIHGLALIVHSRRRNENRLASEEHHVGSGEVTLLEKQSASADRRDAIRAASNRLSEEH